MKELKDRINFRTLRLMLYSLLVGGFFGFFLLGSRVLLKYTEIRNNEMGGRYLSYVGLIMCDEEYTCIHEVGHWVDHNLNWISGTEEFKRALDLVIEECEVSSQSEPWCSIKDFPGINGNPTVILTTGETWGSYLEAYAELYKFLAFDHIPIHPTLYKFFNR